MVRPSAPRGSRGAQVPGLGKHGGTGRLGGGPGDGQAGDGPVGTEVALQGTRQPVGLPDVPLLGVGAGAAGDGSELRPLARARLAEPAAGLVREQEPVGGLPHPVSDMQPGRLREMGAHPPGPLDVAFGPDRDLLAVQPQPGAYRLRACRLALVPRGHVGGTEAPGIPLQGPAEVERGVKMLLDPAAHHRVSGQVKLQRDDSDLIRPPPVLLAGLAAGRGHHSLTKLSNRNVAIRY